MVIGIFLSAASGRAVSSGKTLEISEKNAELLDHIGDYSDLEVLSISCHESLQSLPDSIGKRKVVAVENCEEVEFFARSISSLMPITGSDR
jgi:hypothetical protein